MSDDNTQASIAELKEAVSNLKDFTRRAETTLEGIRKDVTDRSHALRNEFQVKFTTIENNIDDLKGKISNINVQLKDRTCIEHGSSLTELKNRTNFLEKVTYMGLGAVALFEIFLKVIK